MPEPSFRRRTPPKDLRVIDIEIPNDVNYIEKVVEMVRHECEANGFAHRQLALNVPVALAEALSNAILRGNGDDPKKHVRVRAEVDNERLVVEIADEGPGFDFDAKMIDPADGDLDREDGRGLFLMRKLMDRVERVAIPNGSAVRMTLNRA
jgi:serine/threonine-protein kinase RsbW